MKRLLFSIFLWLPCFVSASGTVSLSFAVQESYFNFPVVVDLKKFTREALAKENISATFMPFPLFRGTMSMDQGEIDGEMLRDKESMEGFSQIITTDHPLFLSKVKIMYLKENKKFSAKHLQNFNGVTVMTNQSILRKMKKENLRFIEVQKPEKALSLLEQKRVDYFIVSEPVIEGLLEEDPHLKETFAIDNSTFMIVKLFMALNKKHTDLMPRVERALRNAIKNDIGQYKHLQNGINKDF
jgi:hypothetical protein